MSYCNRHHRPTERRFVSSHYEGGRYISSGYRDVCPECSPVTTQASSTDDDGASLGNIASDTLSTLDTFTSFDTPDTSSSDTGGSSFDFGGGGGFDGGGGGDSF